MAEMDDQRKAAMRRCGICDQGPVFNWALRLGQVCHICEERAVDSHHRPLIISQESRAEDGTVFVQNPRAFLGKGLNGRILPNDLCTEVSESGRCWVDGIECMIWEGRMGGVGLVVVNFPDED